MTEIWGLVVEDRDGTHSEQMFTSQELAQEVADQMIFMQELSALYLVGDEDTGVGLGCRLCDRGGLPLAYYPGISGNPYTSQGVPTCESIESLIHQMRIHLRVVHG